MWSRFVCWIDQDPLSHACPLPSTWKEVILYAAIVQSILPLASMGTMGFFIVTIRKHNAIRLLSFLCLYASLTASVAWSVYFRSYRCILASCTLLVATVLGHSIMNESIRIHLILILILVACSLILLISVYSLCLAIRGNGSIAIECAWTMVFLCLSLQGLMLVLAGYGAFIHGILSVLPTACLLVLSVIFYLTITVIRSLRKRGFIHTQHENAIVEQPSVMNSTLPIPITGGLVILSYTAAKGVTNSQLMGRFWQWLTILLLGFNSTCDLLLIISSTRMEKRR